MGREYDKEKILDKMRELRDKRDLELVKQELDNASSENENFKNKVLDVKYLGSFEIDGKEKDIFLLIEQNQKDNGDLDMIEKYYSEDGEFLGIYRSQINIVLPSERYKENTSLVNKLSEINKEGKDELNKTEQDRVKEIAKTLGISEKDIDKMVEIDPKKDVDKWHKDLTNEQVRELQEDGIEPSSDEYREYLINHGLSLPKEEAKEVVSTKSEIKTDQKVNDKDTIASFLNIEEKGYTKIAVVYSDKLQDNNNTTRFSFVGIKQDGSAEIIDTLEQAYGKTPTKNVQTINRDGTSITEERVNSIYRIKGKNEEQLAVNIGQFGTIEPKLMRTPRQNGEEAISIPIETQNVMPTTRETREYMSKAKNPNINNNIEEIKKHKAECGGRNIRNTDDNAYNNTHEHVIIENAPEYAKKVIQDDEISEVYNLKDAERIVKDFIIKNPEVTIEKLIELVKDDMKKSAKFEHPLHKTDKQ